jgi:hypothetical protein
LLSGKCKKAICGNVLGLLPFAEIPDGMREEPAAPFPAGKFSGRTEFQIRENAQTAHGKIYVFVENMQNRQISS